MKQFNKKSKSFEAGRILKSVKVCKVMFLNTVGRSSDSFIQTHFKSKAVNQAFCHHLMQKEEKQAEKKLFC